MQKPGAAFNAGEGGKEEAFRALAPVSSQRAGSWSWHQKPSACPRCQAGFWGGQLGPYKELLLLLASSYPGPATMRISQGRDFAEGNSKSGARQLRNFSLCPFFLHPHTLFLHPIRGLSPFPPAAGFSHPNFPQSFGGAAGTPRWHRGAWWGRDPALPRPVALSTVQHPRTQPQAHILHLDIPQFLARGFRLSLKTPQSPSQSCSHLSKTLAVRARGEPGVTPGVQGTTWGSVLLLLPPQKSSSRNSAAEIESASGRDISSWFLRRAPGLPVVPRQLAALNISLYLRFHARTSAQRVPTFLPLLPPAPSSSSRRLQPRFPPPQAFFLQPSPLFFLQPGPAAGPESRAPRRGPAKRMRTWGSSCPASKVGPGGSPERGEGWGGRA